MYKTQDQIGEVFDDRRSGGDVGLVGDVRAAACTPLHRDVPTGPGQPAHRLRYRGDAAFSLGRFGQHSNSHAEKVTRADACGELAHRLSSGLMTHDTQIPGNKFRFERVRRGSEEFGALESRGAVRKFSALRGIACR